MDSVPLKVMYLLGHGVSNMLGAKKQGFWSKINYSQKIKLPGPQKVPKLYTFNIIFLCQKITEFKKKHLRISSTLTPIFRNYIF
jgi:hypothetical protein